MKIKENGFYSLVKLLFQWIDIQSVSLVLTVVNMKYSLCGCDAVKFLDEPVNSIFMAEESLLP